MATPLLSKKISIVIDGSTMLCPNDFSLSMNKDILEITCMGSSGSKRSIPDMYGWNISFSGTAYETAGLGAGDYTYENLVSKLKTDASVGIYYLPDVSANKYYGGAGYITSISISGGAGSPVTYSGEVTGDGDLVEYTTT